MWLIDVRDMSMIEVIDPEKYRYVVLSHRWGRDEVMFEDMADPSGARQKAGFIKIQKTCRLAERKRIWYAWIDTCCIDKSSSTALSEAINSMFRWYQLSSVCFAHLYDLRRESSALEEEEEDMAQGAGRVVTDMADCEWFTRGWTLQELIAPEVVEFYDRGWEFRGTKSVLRHEISHITGIDVAVLEDSELLPTVALARRMSWASDRETTKLEDRAYCLLGIFGINIPMIYGEGQGAFIRLQEEIAKRSNDLSLFAWTAHEDPRQGIRRQHEYRGIFAHSPAEFASCRDMTLCRDQLAPMKEFQLSNNGCLRIETYLAPAPNKDYILSLDCTDGTLNRQKEEKRIGIYLMKTETGYVRCKISEIFTTFDKKIWATGHNNRVYIRKDLSVPEAIRLRAQLASSLVFLFHKPEHSKIIGFQARPRSLWDHNGKHFITSDQRNFTAYVSFSIMPRIWRFVVVCGLLDPSSNNPAVIGPVMDSAGMVPWVAVFTDQHPTGATRIGIIDRIMEKSNEEKGLSRLRGVVLGWHKNKAGELLLHEMNNKMKVAADDQGERQYHVVVRRDFKDGTPVFNVNVFIQDISRLEDNNDPSNVGSHDTDPGYTPDSGFAPRFVPQAPRSRTPAPERSPFEPLPRRPPPPPQRPPIGVRGQPFVPVWGGGGGGVYSPGQGSFSPMPPGSPFSPTGYGPPPPSPGAFSPGYPPPPFGSPYAGIPTGPMYGPGYGYEYGGGGWRG